MPDSFSGKLLGKQVTFTKDSSSEFARQEFDRPMTWPIGDIVENKKGVSKWKLIKKMKIKSKQKTKLKNNNQTI